MPRPGFSFVHLTDPHLIAGGGWHDPADGWTYDTNASLRRVIDAINGLERRPAFAVVSGDLVSPDLQDTTRAWRSEEYEPSYRLLRRLLLALPCPVHLTLGNHDDRTAFHRVFEDGKPDDRAWYYAFDHQSWRFVVLETLLPGSSAGRLDPEQLAWLRADLAAHRDRPTLVFLHHPPWPVGLDWIDAIRLENGEELEAAIRAEPAVRWIVSGHVHVDAVVQRRGLTLITTPSTGVQLSRVSQTPKVLPGPPAFRVIEIEGDDLRTRMVPLVEGRSDV